MPEKLANLWIRLDQAMHRKDDQVSILERLSILPWESHDQEVQKAWTAIVQPENIIELEKWLLEDVNPNAKNIASEALRQAKRRYGV